ncbi:MAG TPA: zinc-binding dehydrogenase [Acidimicrobiales bacterium]|nr:zinc-binding dehydrogenase [Acidimicrobiales bacterium]
MKKALVFERNLPRFAAARVAAMVAGSGRGTGIGPLRLTEIDPPALPGPAWHRIRPTLAGICGSDLATLDAKSSRYFEELVSFPFVPGHEIVGVVEEASGPDPLAPMTRVVVEPVLGCIPRAIAPPCPACAEGRTGGCERVAFGHLSPGLQIGYCADTGGGWSAAGLVAHRLQLHAVPDDFTDEDAVMVEPTACAVHAVLDAAVDPGAVVAVLGAGTLGLAAIAALRTLTTPATLIAGAKHAHQRRLAADLGADGVVTPEQLPRAVRRQSRSLINAGQLTGGADIVVDCVGSAESLSQALAMVRPRGRIVLVGMPGPVHVDLAPLWHREVALTGAYAYGTELVGGIARRTFDVAMDVVAAHRLGRLVSARYPLERYEEAVAHAGAAGRRGAVKVVFDLDARPPASPARRRPAPKGPPS